MTSHVSFTAKRLFDLGASAGPVLGIDTSSRVAALGIVAGGRILGDCSVPSTSHGSGLPSLAANLLKKAQLSIADLLGLAVGTGPGSYTGLRVGISYIKGLAMALAIPVAGVSSLDSIATAAAAMKSPEVGSYICPIMDARKGEIYTALYRVGIDALEKMTEDLVTAPEHLINRIDGEVLLVGDAKVHDASTVLTGKGVRFGILNSMELAVHGRFVAVLGAGRIVMGGNDLLATLEPRYGRPIDATFKPTNPRYPAAGTEGLWTPEKSSLFGNLQPTTRN